MKATITKASDRNYMEPAEFDTLEDLLKFQKEHDCYLVIAPLYELPEGGFYYEVMIADKHITIQEEE